MGCEWKLLGMLCQGKAARRKDETRDEGLPVGMGWLLAWSPIIYGGILVSFKCSLKSASSTIKVLTECSVALLWVSLSLKFLHSMVANMLPLELSGLRHTYSNHNLQITNGVHRSPIWVCIPKSVTKHTYRV